MNGGIIASGDELHPDGYSHNCIIEPVQRRYSKRINGPIQHHLWCKGRMGQASEMAALRRPSSHVGPAFAVLSGNLINRGRDFRGRVRAEAEMA